MTHHVPLMHTYVTRRIQQMGCLKTDPYGKSERDTKMIDNEVVGQNINELEDMVKGHYRFDNNQSVRHEVLFMFLILELPPGYKILQFKKI